MMALKCIINAVHRNKSRWEKLPLGSFTTCTHMHYHQKKIKIPESLGTEALNYFGCPRCPMGHTWQSACLEDATFYLRVSPSLNASVSTFPKAWSSQNAWNALLLVQANRTGQLKYDSLLIFKENFKESVLVLVLLYYLSELKIHYHWPAFSPSLLIRRGRI